MHSENLEQDEHLKNPKLILVCGPMSLSPLRKERAGWTKVAPSSPAHSVHRLYLPACLGLHCIWNQRYHLSIYTPLLNASRAPAPIQYSIWCWPRSVPAQTNAGKFKNRSMIADIHQATLSSYLSLVIFRSDEQRVLDKDTFVIYFNSLDFNPLRSLFIISVDNVCLWFRYCLPQLQQLREKGLGQWAVPDMVWSGTLLIRIALLARPAMWACRGRRNCCKSIGTKFSVTPGSSSSRQSEVTDITMAITVCQNTW